MPSSRALVLRFAGHKPSLNGTAMLETITHKNGVVELRLARPPVNALNPELVAALDQALREHMEPNSGAIVISGQPGMFSAGLDVPALLQLDRDGMRSFWKSLFDLLERIARSPVPVVSALTGHSPAGGTVIALFCDYRVAAQSAGDKTFRMGLNEVQVGLVVPPVIQRALARLIGPYAAERHLVAGDMIAMESAHSLGLVDELVPAAEVTDRAVAWSRSLLALPQHSMRATRRLCRADLAALFDDRDGLDIDGFVDGWFAEATQATLKQLVARLAGG